MKLDPFVRKAHIRFQFDAQDKTDFFKKMVKDISTIHPDFEEERLLELFYLREETMSTGIGNGIAIPHVMYEKCENQEIFVYRLAKPIDFAALDKEPVELIFVMVGAPSPSNIINLQILAKLALMMKHPEFLETLLAAESEDALFEALIHYD
ncbi:MAG: PTS sugar transporter subunit IIA [Holophagae bacterium]|nr:PTS sugar transporter subunit IIA [Holophagae bacterium]